MKKLDFQNTEIAFKSLSDRELLQAYTLFKTMSSPLAVDLGTRAATLAFKFHLPIKTLIRATVFRQFCGGESIEGCAGTIARLKEYGVSTILDYSVEGKSDEASLDATYEEIIRTINYAKTDPSIAFCVFKPTGIIDPEILAVVSAGKKLSETQELRWVTGKARFHGLCASAANDGIRIFVDAEDSWIQNAIDDLALEAMRQLNRAQPLVYTTLQMYRHDRLAYLKELNKVATEGNFQIGIKLVRGAYLEKERHRAQSKGYPSPIQPDKASTDRDYDEALTYICKHIGRFGLCAGTHNEASTRLLTSLAPEAASHADSTKKEAPRFVFAQLLGMSDNLTFNLARAGWHTAKYVPYGPVEDVLPYLNRRAQENTSIRGQTGREMALIAKELKRRKVF